MKNTRAKQFQRVRKQRFLEIAEDYTELIADILSSQKKVRVCDIAKEMGVSHVNVLKTIQRLIRDKYLTKDALELTDKGKKTASFSKKKHLILAQFLQRLGVPDSIAAIDVEGIEHHISKTTLKAIESQLKKMN